ncbi:MAG TPA: RluA family pseudouridine synthase [Thermoanaerobaculia bacterium]|nr:RluA family pseudouridine synthase [Thermoanaerobaculia bacterium]
MNVLYEDSALIFVDKPGDIVVQRGYDADEPVLLEDVSRYLEDKGETAFLMQRLDRGTSGVIFFSKLSKINANLTRQFERRQIRKIYLAICEGSVRRQLVDAPLARIGPISFGVRSEGKRAITAIEPLAEGRDATLVRVTLLTGRTHQIRSHCAAIGHPLVGDWLYGQRNASRPMLHASSLAMRHPLTGEPMTINSPLPADFLKELGHREFVPGE